jgi:methylthioribose-1-phosphate isomerase
MRVDGIATRAIWQEGLRVCFIDQTPFCRTGWRWCGPDSVTLMARAIGEMQVRGAPLIGAVARLRRWRWRCSAMRLDDSALDAAARRCSAAHPAHRCQPALGAGPACSARGAGRLPVAERAARGRVRRWRRASPTRTWPCNAAIGAPRPARCCGRSRRARPGRCNVLTHCNAGWLATVDCGTALAPDLRRPHEAGVAVHVWVDETRPRNQGASLTAWELGQRGVPHTVIADNAGGHLMQRGPGRRGDRRLPTASPPTATSANKIGTYLKALAAHDNGIPFLGGRAGRRPSTAGIADGVTASPSRPADADELHCASAGLRCRRPEVVAVRVTPEGSAGAATRPSTSRRRGW